MPSVLGSRSHVHLDGSLRNLQSEFTQEFIQGHIGETCPQLASSAHLLYQDLWLTRISGTGSYVSARGRTGSRCPVPFTVFWNIWLQLLPFISSELFPFTSSTLLPFTSSKLLPFTSSKILHQRYSYFFFIKCYKVEFWQFSRTFFFLLFLFQRSTSFPCQLYSTVTVAMFFFNFIRDKSKNFFKKHTFYGLQGFLDKALHATIQHWPRIVVAIFHMESLYSMGRVILAFQDSGQEINSILSDGAYCQHCLSFPWFHIMRTLSIVILLLNAVANVLFFI